MWKILLSTEEETRMLPSDNATTPCGELMLQGSVETSPNQNIEKLTYEVSQILL